MKRRSVGVLGATGTIGQTFLTMLGSHPYFDVECLAASERSAGKRLSSLRTLYPIEEEMLEMPIQALGDIDASSLEIVFSALPSDIAGPIESELAGEGVWVFSNASAHRMDPDVPILIPEVNAHHTDAISRQTTPGKIVTNSNCTTVGLVMALAPIRDVCARVHMASYQAVSGAGYPGLPVLDALGNVIPFIGGEEGKVQAETRKMLGLFTEDGFIPWNVPVDAQCARVPVRDGHTGAVCVDLLREVDPGDVADAMERFTGDPQRMGLPTAPERPLIVRREMDRPQPLLDVMAGSPERARGMSISVGRIRVQGSRLMFHVLTHNLVRGGAGESVLNAEYVLARGLMQEV